MRICCLIRPNLVVMKTALIAGILVSCATAQIPAEPPAVIRVVPNASIEPYFDGQAAVNVLGMSAISGPSLTWLVELHDTFGSLEDLDKTLSAISARTPAQSGLPMTDGALAPSRTLVAVYRPEFSYRPGPAVQALPAARYFDVVVYRIRPGTEAEFAKLVRSREFASDSLNLDRPELAYQVVSGAAAGTYLFLAPLSSLRILDDGRPSTPVYAEGASASIRKTVADMEIVRERLWFRIEPRRSHVSGEFATQNPGFWRPQ